MANRHPNLTSDRSRAWVRALVAPAVLAVSTGVPAQPPAAVDPAVWQRQVSETEKAFARSMAERNLAAFTALLSEQAVFIGGRQVQRGKAAVVAAWKPFFTDATAPFSWAPDQVEVLADGSLAHSSGPVRDADGKLVSRFNSVWRQEAPGVWRIVFDKGEPLTEADRQAAGASRP